MASADGPANVQNRNSVRSPASITWAVWKARGLSPGAAWILVEPVEHLDLQICFLDANS
jgi:hypothetical protein